MSTVNARSLPHGEILIVEDNASSLKLLSDILTKAGYKVRPASDGELALQSLQAKLPDLILLDFKLPGIDGVEVCRHLKDAPATRDIPVIFISAFGDAEMKVTALEAGAVDYIAKPIDTSEVLVRINTHLRMYQMQRRLVDQTEELGKHRDHLEALVEERTTALRESEERFRRLAENAQDVIYRMSLPDGRYEYVSPAATEIFGYTPDEFLHSPGLIRNVIQPEWQEYFAEQWEALLAGDMPPFYEYQIVHGQSGEARWLHQRNVLVRDKAGRPAAIESIVTDITARKRLEEQFRQSQKMEAVGQLAGGIAHDFNNLLQALLGYGEIVLDEIEPDNPARASVEEMLKAGNRAKTLVRQLLAFSRRQILDMRDVSLDDLIADSMKMIRRVIGEHITLNAIASHDLGNVRADPGQIEQIVMNLCVNARDAMPEGGTIVVKTENVQIDEDFCTTHTWAKPGSYVLLSMTDTGAGMDDETLAQAFEPFFTTKGVGEGTGLGLSTVYGLVKQHQGMIHVYSEVGEGTTFKIYLPLIEPSAPAVSDTTAGLAPGGTETILLAEDETMVRKLTQAILERAGYSVLPAADGEEALRVFEEHSEAIDLALLDVMMPHLGGKAVFERIREARPDIRVLFASGYSMEAIHTNFVLEANLALIQKPCQRNDLLRKVREVLDSDREESD